MRLAKACGRLHDVDGLLDELTPAQYRELIAYDRLEPLDPANHWGEILLHCLCRGFAWMATAKAGKIVPERTFDPRPRQGRGARAEQRGARTKPASVAEQKALIRRSIGSGGV